MARSQWELLELQIHRSLDVCLEGEFLLWELLVMSPFCLHASVTRLILKCFAVRSLGKDREKQSALLLYTHSKNELQN